MRVVSKVIIEAGAVGIELVVVIDKGALFKAVEGAGTRCIQWRLGKGRGSHGETFVGLVGEGVDGWVLIRIEGGVEQLLLVRGERKTVGVDGIGFGRGGVHEDVALVYLPEVVRRRRPKNSTKGRAPRALLFCVQGRGERGLRDDDGDTCQQGGGWEVVERKTKRRSRRISLCYATGYVEGDRTWPRGCGKVEWKEEEGELAEGGKKNVRGGVQLCRQWTMRGRTGCGIIFPYDWA